MSLNMFQRRSVTKTLLDDLDRSGLTRDQVQADLGISADQLDRAIRLAAGGDPTHIWLVRDYPPPGCHRQRWHSGHPHRAHRSIPGPRPAVVPHATSTPSRLHQTRA